MKIIQSFKEIFGNEVKKKIEEKIKIKTVPMLCHSKRILRIKIIVGFISQTQPGPFGIFFIF